MKYTIKENGDIVIDSIEEEIKNIKKFIDLINPGGIDETLVKEIILRNLTFAISSVLFTYELEFDQDFPTKNVIIPYKELNSIMNLWDHDLRITIAEIRYKDHNKDTVIKKMYGRQD